jgi:hypothetical protein
VVPEMRDDAAAPNDRVRQRLEACHYRTSGPAKMADDSSGTCIPRVHDHAFWVILLPVYDRQMVERRLRDLAQGSERILQ